MLTHCIFLCVTNCLFKMDRVADNLRIYRLPSFFHPYFILFCSLPDWATTRFVAASEDGEGVPLEWPKGDRTLLQVDHSSISPDSTQQEVCTLYKFLTHLERVKRLTEYKLSYSECTRQQSGGSSTSTDGFQITLKEMFKYKSLGGERAPTQKSIFARCMQGVSGSSWVAPVFRWRFERVHAICKVQKPYVINVKAISLRAGSPQKIV